MTGPTPPVPWRPLGDTGVHFWRVQRMARTSGVDPVEAFDQGNMTQQDWVDMVQRCRSCPWVDGCARWLNRHADAPGTPPPETCLNAKGFKRLSERQD